MITNKLMNNQSLIHYATKFKKNYICVCVCVCARAYRGAHACEM